MKTDTIVQFECFETNIGLDEFVLRWEQYAKAFLKDNAEVTLQKRVSQKSRFKYISQHEWPQDSFQFEFMKGRYSENFPEGNVKVIQAGGYAVLQMHCIHDADPKDVKIILFIKNEKILKSCRQAPFYRFLNIYESYFESCLYAYVAEFFVKEEQADDFIKWIENNAAGAEAGIYKECMVLHE